MLFLSHQDPPEKDGEASLDKHSCWPGPWHQQGHSLSLDTSSRGWKSTVYLREHFQRVHISWKHSWFFKEEKARTLGRESLLRLSWRVCWVWMMLTRCYLKRLPSCKASGYSEPEIPASKLRVTHINQPQNLRHLGIAFRATGLPGSTPRACCLPPGLALPALPILPNPHFMTLDFPEVTQRCHQRTAKQHCSMPARKSVPLRNPRSRTLRLCIWDVLQSSHQPVNQ